MKIEPIVIIAGEPNSIFLEIFFKSLKSNKYKKPLILIVSKKLLISQMDSLGYQYKINIINIKKKLDKNLDNKKINILDVDYNFTYPFEKISNKSNFYISKCFKIGIDFIGKNKCSGLINGPVSKKKFLNGKYLGITEYIASKTKKKKISMLIYNEKLSVSPITTHLPLKDVHKNISQIKIVDQVKLIVDFYKKKLKKNPRIAITGLNPHCESNYKTSEEEKIIKPAIKKLNNKNFNVKGPFAADTIFMKEQAKKYDVIIGMYHDQVLTPVKTLFGFDAINITLGLPFIRISPDHGPNISMLGKNLSSPISLIKALKFLDK